MNHISRILDCTIRDGGYYNKWNFSNHFIKDYLKLMSALNVDWVEIGFRKDITNKIYGNFVRTDDSFLSTISIPKNLKLCVMIDLSDFKSSPDLKKLKSKFHKKNKSKISMVRIAASYEDLNYLKPIVKILKSKDYTVCINLMKFTLLNDNQIISFFKKALEVGCENFYVADSFGCFKPNQVKKLCLLLAKNNFALSKFGYHGHNNFNLAFENAIQFEKNGFGLIDTSIMGMGRGAGNLLFEKFLNKKIDKLKKNLIKKFIQKHMNKLKKNFSWGPSYPYEYSAKNNIHPTYVQNLLNEKKFTFKQIYQILKFLKLNNSKKFDANIFDNLFLKTLSFNPIISSIKKDEITLLCNSPQLSKTSISKIKPDQCASLNINQYIDEKYYKYLFLCHPYRLMTEIKTIINLKKKIVIPNFKILKILSKKYNEVINYNFVHNKNLLIKNKYCASDKNLVLVYALSFCIKEKIKKIKIIGLSKNSENSNIIKSFRRYIRKNKTNTSIISN